MQVKKKRFSEEIAHAVQQKIADLGLQEGDKLPSHASLAKELNVSVPSLREGLQMLATLGILTINHGVGTIVAKPSVSNYLRILDTVLQAKAPEGREYLEICQILQPRVVAQVAEQGGRVLELPDSLKRLEEAAAKQDVEEFISENLRFHGQLYRLGDNTVVAEILNIVNKLLFAQPYLRMNVSSNMETIIDYYRTLLEVLVKKDAQAAEQAIKDYLALLEQPQMMSLVYDTFCTGSIGGSFYSAGREICRILHAHGISIESEPSGGGIENVQLTAEGKAVLGLTQSEVAFHAYMGEGPFFEPHEQIRAVCGAQSLDLWIVAREGSRIGCIPDLRGKRIAMGAIGGESGMIAKAILQAYGIKDGDFRPFYLSISNAVQGMRSAEIDLIFYLSNGPGSALADLSEEGSIKILSIDPDLVIPVLEIHPYWQLSTINKNVWAPLTEDVITLRTSTLLITHKAVPHQLIKRIVAVIMEHAGEISFEYSDGVKFGVESALQGISIPLHSGAEEYFRERGLLDD
ncbi:MAG: TAXI family TRAP transporter solute-binding subunit [Spirochaetaceae bacterium]|nr:MAG: TAXI family TRAP transporter solute-binding subunit [Spirochaetaceae bacterium]